MHILNDEFVHLNFLNVSLISQDQIFSLCFYLLKRYPIMFCFFLTALLGTPLTVYNINKK